MRAVAALCLSGLLGCAPQELRFAYVGSDEGFVHAQAAAEEWRAVCGSDISVERSIVGIPLIERPTDAVIARGIETETAAGATVVKGRDVVRIEFVASGRERIVLLHEFGHALGLGHEPRGIMALASERTIEDERVTSFECGLMP